VLEKFLVAEQAIRIACLFRSAVSCIESKGVISAGMNNVWTALKVVFVVEIIRNSRYYCFYVEFMEIMKSIASLSIVELGMKF